MLEIGHVVLPSPFQMDFVIEGMRNAHNSWDKSDSNLSIGSNGVDFKLGDNDLELMKRLSSAGTDHRKYMRMMTVMLRITAPLYWWKEFDTYKVGTVANSCSTMHKIHDRHISYRDLSTENLIEEDMSILKKLMVVINWNRDKYLETRDKRYWEAMIQLLPSSYNQTRNVMLNYEVLDNIYYSRKAHKLEEWQRFCRWIETLPYSELITGEKYD